MKKFKNLFTCIKYLLLGEFILGFSNFIYTTLISIIYRIPYEDASNLQIKYPWDAILGLLITFILLFIIYKKNKRDIKISIIKLNPKIITTLIGLSISVYFLNTGILSTIYYLHYFKNFFDDLNKFNNIVFSSNFIMVFIQISIMGPIVEEFLFRELIYTKLTEAFSIRYTIIIQSLLFGIYHFSLIQIISAISIGVLFGYLRYKFNSLIPSLIIHSIVNAISELNFDIMNNLNISIVLSIVGLISFIGIIMYIKNINLMNNQILCKKIKDY